MPKLTRADVERIVAEAREQRQRLELGGVDLSGVNLNGANLSGANLRDANLRDADLSDANLRGADLRRVILSGAYLSLAYLSDANLRGAYLSRANLIGADLRGADLSGANLSGANLSGANLSGANLSGAKIASTTFGDVDFSLTKGLETVDHRGPSSIDTHTFTRSKGQIPIKFLRGCGLSDLDIEYAKLHNPNLTAGQVTDILYKINDLYAANPIHYNSCFISYSHQDQPFAQRLYDNLQDSGVRCWYAPEDLKTGDRLRPTIDQSIRLHDKLLLVLSKHSVTSQWVEHEVEHALDLEQERQESVLFPVRLDETVMERKTGWAATVKRGHHIGDFTQWENKTAYQTAFNRLLRDLEAAP